MKIVHGLLLSSLALTGCIDSGSDSDADNSASTVNFDGKVADGYLVNAKVCLDLNNNYACDSDEPFATSSAGGAFSLSGVTQAQVDSHSVIVEVIAGETYDEDAGDPAVKIQTAYKLTAPAGSQFISPITTIVKGKMDGGLSLQESIDEVKDVLGDDFDPTTDYVAAKESNELTQAERDIYERGHKVAQVIAGLIANELNANDQKNINSAILVIEDKLSDINTQVVDNPNSTVEDIQDSIDLSCTFCGIWHREETDDTAGTYLVIRSDNGIADYFVIDDVNHEQTVQECYFDDSSIKTDSESVTTWRSYKSDRDALDIEDGEPAYYDSIISLSSDAANLTATYSEGTLQFNRVNALPELCNGKASDIRATNLHGVWIGEYFVEENGSLVIDTSGSLAGAYVFNEDGSGMYLESFEGNNPSCEDYEYELHWSLLGSKLILDYTDIINGSDHSFEPEDTEEINIDSYENSGIQFSPATVEVNTGPHDSVTHTLIKKLSKSNLTVEQVKSTCSAPGI